MVKLAPRTPEGLLPARTVASERGLDGREARATTEGTCVTTRRKPAREP